MISFKQLKNCDAGELVRFESGTIALLSQYFSQSPLIPDAYILGTGESLSTNDPDEWVMVIDEAWLVSEVEQSNPVYPDQTTTKRFLTSDEVEQRTGQPLPRVDKGS